jgi:nucleotide-binding universal stress UspA family protein
VTIVAAWGPHHDDPGPVELACQLGRADQRRVDVLTVVPEGWASPLSHGADHEYLEWVAEAGRGAVAEINEYLRRHPDVRSRADWVSARSVPQEVLARVEEGDAGLLVVGSGEDVAHGRLGITSKTDRLLHSSPVPVAIAPRGYRAPPGARVERVSVAFRGDDATWSLLDRVATIARRSGARTMYPPRVSGAEDIVLEQWLAQAREQQRQAREHLLGIGFTDDTLELEVAVARSWAGVMNVLEWRRTEILVVGSSSTHRLSAVFLGSSAAKIVRHSPVPVVVVP